MLGDFAELALSLARDLHQAALAADDAGEKARLADGCHRMGRGLRQSLALQARLERDAKCAAREDAACAAAEAEARRVRRKTQVKAGIERLVWSEYEPADEEAEELLERLDLLLDAEAEQDGFEQQDPELQIAKLCRAIGYQPPSPLAEDARALPERARSEDFRSSA